MHYSIGWKMDIEMYDQSEAIGMRRYFVICLGCGEKHETDAVEFLNVEEDIQGRDVMEFKCPETDTIQRSWVLSK